ncbi:hypothetical protein LLG95_15840 [bacterium]|nr:hypothetical protein [bacterium]
MPLLSKVILVSQDPRLSDEVHDALSNGNGATVAVCRDLKELKGRLQADQSMVVLVDDGARDWVALGELEPVVNQYAHSRFVLLTGQRSPQILLRSMQIGIRHVQLKSEIAADLNVAVGALVNTLNHRQAARGSMITILSAGGGCGATTLATNMGLELHARQKESVLLVDGDNHYGAIGIYLNIDGRYGLNYLLGAPEKIDSVLVQSTASHYRDGFDVLLNPIVEKPIYGAEPSAKRFGELLEVCLQSYGTTILDLPRPSPEMLHAAARVSTLLLIVMQPAVKDIRMARILMNALEMTGVGPSQILVVVNRYQNHHNPIQLPQIQKVFTTAELFCVGNDYVNANRAATEGLPLSQCARKSRVAHDVGELASHCMQRLQTSRNEVQTVS